MSDRDPRLSRRSMLGVSAAALLAGPCAAGLSGCGGATSPTLTQSVSVPLADHPDLQNEGVWVRLSPRDIPYDFSIYVRNEGGGVYRAISGYCDHESCDASRNGAGFRCPCHGAAWDQDGRLTLGPARRDLITFDTEFDGQVVTVLPNG